MSNDEKKPRKLTLGTSKLNLSNKSSHPKKITKPLGKSGAVVVEIKRGQVVGGQVSLNRESELQKPARHLAICRWRRGRLRQEQEDEEPLCKPCKSKRYELVVQLCQC